MKQTRASFWNLIFLALALTVTFAFVLLLLIWHQLDEPETRLLRTIAYDHAYYLLAVITLVPVALWVIFEICHTRFYLPLKRIPSEISLIFRSNPAHRLELEGNQDIRELSEAINDFAKRYEYLTEHITAEIEQGQSETEKERNLLAAIMSELPLGLIICNANGRILLFNSQAKNQFSNAPPGGRSENFLGLGRSVYHLIDRTLIAHALEEIEERLAGRRNRVASYFITYTGDTALILVETIPVLSEEQLITGFILSLQDISGTVERYEAINASLLTLDQNVSSRLMQVENLLQADTRIDLTIRQAVLTELAAVRNGCTQSRHAILDAAFETMPLTKLELGPLLFLFQQQAGAFFSIRINVAAPLPGTRILGDTYSFIAALVFLAQNLAQLTGNDEFQLSVSIAETDVFFDISWDGNPLPPNALEELLSRKIPSLTRLDYVLKQNKASATVPSDSGNNTIVRIVARAERSQPSPGGRRAPVVAGAKPAFYDFALFEVDDENQDLLNCPLGSLTFTVIDTETTGLDPEGGDEIIALGGVRIVRSKVIYDDRFDQLINPGRSIPFDSYRVHGIDEDMLADKPSINQVLPAFRRFVSDTIVIGHDIAFDMKMLKMKEADCGVYFTNLLLDTLLLSALLHPVHTQHDLDSIARRLGVTIVGRHTAIGDAVATAEIFVKLIPILQIKGVETLDEAIQASKRAYIRRLRY